MYNNVSVILNKLTRSTKIQQCVFEFSAKTKHDGQTDRRMGAFQYLPFQAFGAAGDKKSKEVEPDT